MKRKIGLLFIVAILVFTVGAALACSKVKLPDKRTVTYYYNYVGAPDDGVYLSEKVNVDSAAKKPANPTRNGYLFDKWTTDTAGNSEYDFTKKVTQHLKLYAQWTEKPADPILTDIEITAQPNKTTYIVNQPFDKTGMVVKAVYDNGDKEEITDYQLEYDFSVVNPAAVVTVKYQGKDARVTVEVVARAVVSVKVTGTPSKTFKVGDAFDMDGLTFTATYNDDLSETITTDLITFTSPALDSDNKFTTTGNAVITFTYNGTITVTPTITVNVQRTLTDIEITAQPTKKTYYVGETFDKAGMVVKAVYDSGDKEEITDYQLEYDFSVANPSAVVNVMYQGKSKQVIVEVLERIVVSVAVSGTPSGTFKVGDAFVMTGLTFTATYNVGDPATISTDLITFTSPALDSYGKFTKSGNAVITFTYNDEITVTPTITVNVQRTLTDIEITAQPTKKTYYVGETFDKAGMVVKAVYDSGDKEEITDYQLEYDFSVANPSAVVNVMYQGKSKQVIVEVLERIVVSVAVSGTPSGTFKVGDAFVMTGLTFTATYNVGDPATISTDLITFTSPALDNNGKFTTDGDAVITFTYNGTITVTPTITVNVQPAETEPDPVLTGIVVSAQPSKTTYVVGQTFDNAGMVVEAVYDKGGNKVITDYQLEYDFSAPNPAAVVTVKYQGKDARVTVEVVARAVVSVKVTGTPSKTFRVGDAFDMSGLTFTAMYNDDLPEEINTDLITFTSTALDGDGKFIVSGEAVITFTYNGTITVTPTITVNVNKKQFTVIFDYGYADGGEYERKTVEDGSKVALPAEPERSGYTFLYWSLTENGTACAESDYTITADKTFYAVWKLFTTAESGIYVIGNFNGWGIAFGDSTITKYKVTVLRTNQYSISGLKLAANYEFKFVDYDSTKTGDAAITWTTHDYHDASTSIVPSAAMTVGITTDGNNNFVIKTYDATNVTWTIDFGINEKSEKYVTFIIDGYNMMRDPATGESLTGTNKLGKDNAAVDVAYLIGNFTDGFNYVSDEWAFDTARNSAVKLVNGVYYFQNVMLKKYDEFKILTRSATKQKWQGGTWKLGSPIALSDSNAPNIIVPNDGVYNLVYDGTTLTIYESGKLEATVNNIPYVGQPLTKSDITVTFNSNPVTEYTLVAAQAQSGENTFTVVYNGAVEVVEYTAREPQSTGITAELKQPDKVYYVGDAVDISDITVSVTYNYGNPKVIESGYTVSAFTAADIAKVEALENKFGEITVTLTVSYADHTATLDVIFKNKLTGIDATLSAQKTFFEGDTIAASDFTVYALFNGKSDLKQQVTTDITVTPTTLEAGENNVTVKYADQSKLVVVTATAIVPTSITFTAPEDVPTYRSGNKFLATGYVFTVTYNKGEPKTIGAESITFTSDYLDSRAVFKAVNELTLITITVSYTENNVTVTAEQSITLNLDVAGETEYYVQFLDGLDNYTVTMPESRSVRADAEKLAEPQRPTLKGFTFVGWVCEGSTVTFPLKVNRHMDIVATWSANSYTVEYVLGYEGTLAAGNPTRYTVTGTDKAMQFVPLSLGVQTRTHYTFDGWAKTSGGDRIESLTYADIPETGDKITLYAKWTPIAYTLVYNMGDYGEKINDKPFDITNVNDIVLPTKAQVTINATGTAGGWYFIGWYSAAQGGDLITSIADELEGIGSNTTVTVYAHYSNMYTVTFDANGGAFDGGLSTQKKEVAYNTAVSAPAKNPTLTGNDFDGWYLVVNGNMQTTKYNFATAVKGDITLKAQWRENPKDGWFLRITNNGDWKDVKAIKATSGTGMNGQPEYTVNSVTLAEGALFYLSYYDAAGNANYDTEIKPNGATIGTYITPSQITTSEISFGTKEDGEKNGSKQYLYKVTKYASAYASFKWNMYVQAGQVSISLVNNGMPLRDPDGAENPNVASGDADKAGDKAVYIKGNFNEFKPSVAWSNESAGILTATVGKKYYFTDVYFNKYDTFKMFVTDAKVEGGGTWFGITATAFALDKTITLGKEKANNGGDSDNILFTGASGSYDIVFDVSNATAPTIRVESHKTITVTSGTIYVGATLKSSDFTAKSGTATLTVTLVGDYVAQSGRNTVKLVCGNTVVNHTFTAVEVAATGIEITTQPTNKEYYVGDEFNKDGMVVSVVYNNGNKVATADYTVSALPNKATVGDSFNDSQTVTLTVTATVNGRQFETELEIQLKNKFTGIAVDPFDEIPTIAQGKVVAAGDIANLVVKAVFNNGNVTQELSTEYTISVDTSVIAESVTATVTYRYGDKDYTAEFNVKIVAAALTRIEVDYTEMPEYKIGQTVDKTGLVITAYYNNGKSEIVTDEVDCTITVEDNTHAGITNAKVVYGGKEKIFEITLKALTVTFNVGEGTLNSESTVSVTTYNTNIEKPTDPTRLHYTFGGWMYNGKEWNFEDGVTQDITLIAAWTAESYNVTFRFITEGVDYTATFKDGYPIPDSYTYGEGLTLPTKDDITIVGAGYEFKGWTLDSNPTNDSALVSAIDTTEFGERVFYALISDKASVYVTFDLNYEGAPTLEPVPIVTGRAIQESQAPKHTREGYDFGGWYTDSACSANAKYVFGSSVMGPITLYAKWTLKQYTVTFMVDGDKHAEIKVEHGKTVGNNKPADPEKTGYTFDSWHLGTLDGEVYTFTTPVIGNITLVAAWTANDVTVTFNPAGGTLNADDSITCTYDGVLPELPTPTKDGYSFAGWWSGSTKWEKGNKINVTSLDLVAHWDIIEYTIEYKVNVSVNGVSVTATAITDEKYTLFTVEKEDVFTLPTPSGIKAGYKFKHWTLNGVTVSAITLDSFKNAADNTIELTAVYEIITYTVTFNSNGGTAVASQTIEHGGKVQKPADPEKAGWEFTGWYLGNTLYNFATAVTSDFELDAQWNGKEGTFIYYTIDGTNWTAGQNAKKNGTANEYIIENVPVYNDMQFVIVTRRKSGNDTYLHAAYGLQTEGLENAMNVWEWYGNFKIVDLCSSYEKSLWNITLTSLSGGTVGSDGSLSADATAGKIKMAQVFTNEKRDPSNSGNTITTKGVNGTPTAGVTVYLRGNFTNGFELSDAWSDKSTLLTVLGPVDNNNVYTFRHVYLKKGDSFKVFLPAKAADQQWLGGNFAGVDAASGTALSHNNQPNIYLGSIENNFYDIVVDIKNSKLYIKTYTLPKITEIKVSTNKTTYKVGEPFDEDSLTVTITDGDGKQHNTEYNVSVSDNGTSTAGTKTVTVTYNGSLGGEKTKTFTITVVAINVTFDTVGGSSVDALHPNYNTAFTLPAAPTKAGHTFKGWSDGKASEPYPAKATYNGITDDMSFTAVWEKNKYTVMFMANGEQYGELQTVEYEGTAERPAVDPTKEGYTFKHWSADGENGVEYNFGDKVKDTLTLTAVFEINKYDVKFYVDGEQYGATTKVNHFGTVGVVTYTPATGYEFDGWYTDEACTGAKYDFGTVVTGAVTLYGKTVAIEYKIEYVYEDCGIAGVTEKATFSTTHNTYTVESNFTLDKPTPPAGISFVAWHIDSVNGATISAVTPNSRTGKLKLVAEYTQNAMVWFTFDYNYDEKTDGTKLSNEKGQIVSGLKAIRPADPTLLSHKFLGWYTDSTEGELYNFDNPVTIDTTVYAHWAIYMYTVKFDTVGGTGGDTATKQVEYGDLIPNPGTITRNGYDFGGWYFGGKPWNIATDKLNNAVAPVDTAKATTEVTLTANWTPTEYSITYVLGGGNNDPTNPDSYTVLSNTITLKPATREHYEFKGWHNGTEVITEIAKGSTGHIKLTAQWEAIAYTVEYYVDGSKVTNTGNQATYTIENGTVKLKNPTQTGCEFDGWYRSGDYKGDKVTELTIDMFDGLDSETPVSLYGRFIVNTFSVTFVLGDGTAASGAIYSYTDVEMGTTINVPKDPTPKNTLYDFEGWFDAQTGGTKLTATSITVNGNLTYYARYKAARVRIVLDTSEWGGATFDYHIHAWGGTGVGTVTGTGAENNRWNTRDLMTSMGSNKYYFDISNTGITNIIFTQDEKGGRNEVSRYQVAVSGLQVGANKEYKATMSNINVDNYHKLTIDYGNGLTGFMFMYGIGGLYYFEIPEATPAGPVDPSTIKKLTANEWGGIKVIFTSGVGSWTNQTDNLWWSYSAGSICRYKITKGNNTYELVTYNITSPNVSPSKTYK
ncbi:MAG: InlB B-repeat-containing protein [Clostridiales bacterium]|nr:InlB B-repeat-containing protein [Clostridiales bacterium]